MTLKKLLSFAGFVDLDSYSLRSAVPTHKADVIEQRSVILDHTKSGSLSYSFSRTTNLSPRVRGDDWSYLNKNFQDHSSKSCSVMSNISNLPFSASTGSASNWLRREYMVLDLDLDLGFDGEYNLIPPAFDPRFDDLRYRGDIHLVDSQDEEESMSNFTGANHCPKDSATNSERLCTLASSGAIRSLFRSSTAISPEEFRPCKATERKPAITHVSRDAHIGLVASLEVWNFSSLDYQPTRNSTKPQSYLADESRARSSYVGMQTRYFYYERLNHYQGRRAQKVRNSKSVSGLISKRIRCAALRHQIRDPRWREMCVYHPRQSRSPISVLSFAKRARGGNVKSQSKNSHFLLLDDSAEMDSILDSDSVESFSSTRSILSESSSMW